MKPPTPGLGDCWEWTGYRTPKGYGLVWHAGRTQRAHRVSWEEANGPIPEDLCVLHRCDNPACVRPDHLFLGTRAENNADKKAKGRDARGDANGSRLHPERLARGEAVTNARLTEPKVLQIRSRYAAGETVRALSLAFGVSESTICRVIHKKRWAHVEDAPICAPRMPSHFDAWGER